jgi:hypothetical protein
MSAESVMKELYLLLCPFPCYMKLSHLEEVVLLAWMYSVF